MRELQNKMAPVVMGHLAHYWPLYAFILTVWAIAALLCVWIVRSSKEEQARNIENIKRKIIP